MAPGEAVKGFSDPDGPAAAAQADHLMHDMRADLEAAPDEEGGLFALFDEEEGAARAQIEALDADAKAIAHVQRCLKDPGGAA